MAVEEAERELPRLFATSNIDFSGDELLTMLNADRMWPGIDGEGATVELVSDDLVVDLDGEVIDDRLIGPIANIEHERRCPRQRLTGERPTLIARRLVTLIARETDRELLVRLS